MNPAPQEFAIEYRGFQIDCRETTFNPLNWFVRVRYVDSSTNRVVGSDWVESPERAAIMGHLMVDREIAWWQINRITTKLPCPYPNSIIE